MDFTERYCPDMNKMQAAYNRAINEYQAASRALVYAWDVVHALDNSQEDSEEQRTIANEQYQVALCRKIQAEARMSFIRDAIDNTNNH